MIEFPFISAHELPMNLVFGLCSNIGRPVLFNKQTWRNWINCFGRNQNWNRITVEIRIENRYRKPFYARMHILKPAKCCTDKWQLQKWILMWKIVTWKSGSLESSFSATCECLFEQVYDAECMLKWNRKIRYNKQNPLKFLTALNVYALRIRNYFVAAIVLLWLRLWLLGGFLNDVMLEIQLETHLFH